MTAAYKTGTKDDMIRRMASFAIRDQEALIDAYTPPYGEPEGEAVKVIAEARDNIADFRRLKQLARASAN